MLQSSARAATSQWAHINTGALVSKQLREGVENSNCYSTIYNRFSIPHPPREKKRENPYLEVGEPGVELIGGVGLLVGDHVLSEEGISRSGNLLCRKKTISKTTNSLFVLLSHKK